MKVDKVYKLINSKKNQLPLFLTKVSAGFPSPADDFIEKKLDINELLIKHPAATFLVRVSGTSMVNAGIKSNDILVVDRSLEVKNHNIVIAVIDGELTVKRFKKRNNKVYLLPANKDYNEIEIKQDQELIIWGVVTSVIHQL